MFQRFQNYIQNFSRMHIAESPRLKSIFAIWGSGVLNLLTCQRTVFSEAGHSVTNLLTRAGLWKHFG